MAQQWYIHHREMIVGPVSPSVLRDLAASGELKQAHPVRLGDTGKWIKAGSVTDLFANAKAKKAEAGSHSETESNNPTLTKIKFVLPVAREQTRLHPAVASISTAIVVGAISWGYFSYRAIEPTAALSVPSPVKPDAVAASPAANQIEEIHKQLGEVRRQNAALLKEVSKVSPPPTEPTLNSATSPPAKVAVATPVVAIDPKPAPDQTKAPPTAQKSLADVIKAAEPAVALIECITADGKNSFGSGFLFERDDVVITNFHVVENAISLKLTFNDSKRSERTVDKFLSATPESDLALLQLSAPIRDVAPLTRSVTQPEKGDSVIALGCPKGLEFSASEGIVSGIRSGRELKAILTEVGQIYSDLGLADDVEWLQISAAITNGNSGGPVLTANGAVIGISSWGIPKPNNPSFAVRIDHVPNIAECEPKLLSKLPTGDRQQMSLDEEALARRITERSGLLKRIYEQRLVLFAQKDKVDKQMSQLTQSLNSAQAEYQGIVGRGAAVANLISSLRNQISSMTNMLPYIEDEFELQAQRLAIDSRQQQLQQAQAQYQQLEAEASRVTLEINGLNNQLAQETSRLRDLYSQADRLRVEWLTIVDPFDKLSRREHEAALPVLDEWVVLDANNASAYLCRAFAHYCLGHREKALSDVNNAVRLNGGVLTSSLALRGNLLAESGAEREALADFASAWKLDKSEPLVFLFRGLHYARKESYGLAEQEFVQATKLAPLVAEGHRQLAEFLMLRETTRKSNLARATRSAEKACELCEQKDWLCLVTLSKCYAAAGDFRRAGELIDKAKPLCLFEDRKHCALLSESYSAGNPAEFKLENEVQ